MAAIWFLGSLVAHGLNFFGFILAISALALQLIQKLTDKARTFINLLIFPFLALLVIATNTIYVGYCVGQPSCIGKSRTYTAGSSFQFIALVILDIFLIFTADSIEDSDSQKTGDQV
ncbi:hypothetical protein M0811_03474 [Anaeramoeba ignava]|uniref:Uncharacterized protein n=1 Tax=Anaeramoeba ignava TaxID=1746090 RepID=A0A9Q0L4Z9_ANAIG|nr:hypothetical protein M0811_03474 [Anaeramoeba ignava]